MSGDEELKDLRAEADRLGVKVDRRWGVERLRAEVGAAAGHHRALVGEPAEPEPDAESDTEPDPEPKEAGGPDLVLDPPPPDAVFAADADRPEPVHRAGGHADYGDGRGWVLEGE